MKTVLEIHDGDEIPMKTHDAKSIEVTFNGKPSGEWRPTAEERTRRHLTNVEFKMRLPVEPGATMMIIAQLQRRERNRRKRARRARRRSR